MRYVVRKFIDAKSVQEAIRLDRKTPVHDCYLKDGEQTAESSQVSAIGFQMPMEDGVPTELRKRR